MYNVKNFGLKTSKYVINCLLKKKTTYITTRTPITPFKGNERLIQYNVYNSYNYF